MKILLVDDSKSARYALRLQLQRCGVEVETAASAEAAFELLRGDLPDAILMDHMMPGLNGFEALEIIRADPRTAAIPVVMCTSHEDADFAAAARQRGAVAILPKSAAQEKLPDLLERLRTGSDRHPSPPGKDPVPTRPPVLALVPKSAADQDPELARLIEKTAGGLIDERIESRVVGLIEPLLRDLEIGLSERLLAASRQLIESRLAELLEGLEARLAAEREAGERAHTGRLSAELRTVADHLVQKALPDLVRVEVEVERARVLGLVDPYLRESTAQGTATGDRAEERLAGLDAAIAAKAREVARREASEVAEGAVVRARRIAEQTQQQVRASLTFVYLAILGAALIGILAAAAGYLLRP